MWNIIIVLARKMWNALTYWQAPCPTCGRRPVFSIEKNPYYDRSLRPDVRDLAPTLFVHIKCPHGHNHITKYHYRDDICRKTVNSAWNLWETEAKKYKKKTSLITLFRAIFADFRQKIQKCNQKQKNT